MSTPEVKAILKRKRALALTANNNGDTVYGTPGRGKKAGKLGGGEVDFGSPIFAR